MPDFLSILAHALVTLGRFLLGGYFVVSGIRHFGLLDSLSAEMTRRGLPMARHMLIVVSLLQIALGAMLALGIWVTLSALLLAAFTAAASAVMLNFWEMQEPERDAAASAFLGNVAVFGGLIMAAATPLVRLG